jgi:RNA polymerase sigma factor (sigma-70 family)
MRELKTNHQLSDIDVIQAVISGQTALFELIIRRYNPTLHKIGMSYGFSHEDTQDLMQETFVSTFLNLSKFENRSTFRTWIITIMIRNCIRKKQKFSYKNELVSPILDNSIPMFSTGKDNDINKQIVNRELSQLIESALIKLPDGYRMVFILREVNGLSTLETAEALEISEANVKVRLNRAKAMLRQSLEKAYTREEIFEFNLIYCDRMVERVMHEIVKLSN